MRLPHSKRALDLAVLLVVAAMIFQPWSIRALPILDFSELLPPLAAHESMWDQFLAVTRYMATQGRACVLQYLPVVLAWNAFGIWAPGWHWSYFAVNAAVLVLGYDILLRTGVSRAATFAALLLWLALEPAAAAWLRPTGEPIGLLFLLLGIRVALGFPDARNWKTRIAWIVGATLCIIAAKELLVVLVPVLWVFTRLRHSSDNWEWASWSRRDTVLLVAMGGVIVIAMAVVMFVALNAPDGNYAARYGARQLTIDASIDRVRSFMLPARERLPTLTQLWNDPMWRLWVVLPNLIWIGVLVAGLAVGFRRRSFWPLSIAIAWVIVGVAAYAPWPGSSAFYMLPFAFGMIFGVAHMLTWLFGVSRSAKQLGLAGLLIVCVIAGIEARSQVHEHQLRADLDHAILKRIRLRGEVGRIVAAVPEPVRPGGWGWAERLRSFDGVAGGNAEREAFDDTCEGARRLLASDAGIVVVSAENGCGKLATDAEELLIAYPRYRWPRLLHGQENSRRAFVALSKLSLVSANQPRAEPVQ